MCGEPVKVASRIASLSPLRSSEMRNLVYYVACSVDGFLAHEDGSWEGFLLEGDHVQDYLASLDRFDTVLMGRRTYEVGLREGKSDPYPRMASFVFSTTMTESPDARVTLVSEGAARRVRDLKAQEGRDIYLCGGSDLASTLAREDLIDEIALKVHPFVMGTGIPLFSTATRPMGLSPLERNAYTSGVVLQRFAVDR